MGSSTEPTFSMKPKPRAAQLEGQWGQELAGMLSPGMQGCSGAVWGNEHRGAAQCDPCALGWMQELVASPFCSAGTILSGAGHLSLPAPAAFAASLILRKSLEDSP